MLVGRGVGDAEGVGAATGRARRLAIATRGAGAPRSLAAVLTRAPRSAPYRISLVGTGIDAEKPFNRWLDPGTLSQLLNTWQHSSPVPSSTDNTYLRQTMTKLMHTATNNVIRRVSKIARLLRTEQGADEAGLSGSSREIRCGERALLQRR